ncbi:MAG TPA: tripartite tricarboxylate transporter substrate binding protein [Ramlibacter sp.]|nr:tripartite tricarboxylate transporter substrate binding protein [Ramlibacter sp.]
MALVIPFTPGGGTDNVARLVSQKLEADLGQPLVLEHKPGANGLVASQYVARRPADGYTLLFGSNSTHVIAPLLSKEKNAMADTLRDFTMVGIVGNTTLVLAVRGDSPIKTLAQYLEAAKAKPLTYGTFGLGSSPHLMGAMLASSQKARMLHVPYKGSAPATTDLIGNHIDSVFLTVSAVSTHIASGNLRALAVTGTRRIPSLPDVPTFTEQGVGGLDDAGWFSVFAHAKTPAPILQKLSAALARTVGDPALQAKLVELGLEPASGSPEQFQAAWMRSVKTVETILKTTKIETQ